MYSLDDAVFCNAQLRTACLLYTSNSSDREQISNYRILDNSTGRVEPLNIENIDLGKQPPEALKKLLDVYKRQGQYKGYPLRTYVGNNFQGGYSDHFPVYIYIGK